MGEWHGDTLDAVCARDSSGAVGGLAILCAGLAVASASQHEHVHADRAGCGIGVCL